VPVRSKAGYLFGLHLRKLAWFGVFAVHGRFVEAMDGEVALVTDVFHLSFVPPLVGPLVSSAADWWDSVVTGHEAQHVEQQTAVFGVQRAPGYGEPCFLDLPICHSRGITAAALCRYSVVPRAAPSDGVVLHQEVPHFEGPAHDASPARLWP
jgi:hypothetical protein